MTAPSPSPFTPRPRPLGAYQNAFISSSLTRKIGRPPSDVTIRVPARRYFECYPHLALIGLFGLRRVLPYKVHHDNLEAWREALRLARSLEARALAVCNIADFFPTDLPYTKANEDLLDSVISAYVAAHLWFFGTTQNLIIGSLSTGYMVTPADSALRASLEAGFDPIEINPSGRATSRRPESALPRISAPDVDRGSPATAGGGEPVTLACTDPANLWGNANPWMKSFTGADLLVTFLDVDDQPTLRFVPFERHGDLQRGRRIARDPWDRARWATLAAGASKVRKVQYHAKYQYEIAAKSAP